MRLAGSRGLLQPRSTLSEGPIKSLPGAILATGWDVRQSCRTRRVVQAARGQR